jgi:hypothetical protein
MSEVKLMRLLDEMECSVHAADLRYLAIMSIKYHPPVAKTEQKPVR